MWKGTSLSMEKHMDVLQTCVMVPLPTPTRLITSVQCLWTESRDTQIEAQLQSGRFFHPESRSFPWSLRSAAQSSDRQFFSNQVWRGSAKHTVQMTSWCSWTEHKASVIRQGAVLCRCRRHWDDFIPGKLI